MNWRWIGPGIALASLALVLAACGEDGPNEATIRGLDFAFEVEDDLRPGTNEIVFRNDGEQEHHLQLIRVEGDHTLDEVLLGVAAVEAGGPPPEWARIVGGVGPTSPGETARIVDRLEAGSYALLCLLPDTDGVPHVAKGMGTMITVEGDEADADLPEADVEVRGVDDGAGTSYGFELPETLEAGEQTIRFTNNGSELHEMALLRLEDGVSMEMLAAALAAEGEPPDGPPPFQAIGGVQAIEPGASQIAQMDLEQGTYALICFIPSPDGTPHAVLGMAREFRVQ